MSIREEATKLLYLITALSNGKVVVVKDKEMNSLDDLIQWIKNNKTTIVRSNQFRPWNDLNEMKESFGDRFRKKGRLEFTSIIGTDTTYNSVTFMDYKSYSLDRLYEEFEHTSTPNIDSSWKPCGVEKEGEAK